MLIELIQFPDLDPFLFGPFDIGGFPLGIRWYSLAYIVGLVGGIWLATRMIKSWGQSVTATDIDNLFIWFVIGVVLGGRLFYVLFYGLTTNPQAYSNPLSWIAAWDGGMSFHGGMFGVAMVVMLYAAFKPKVRMLELGDFVAAVAPIGLFSVAVQTSLMANYGDAPVTYLGPCCSPRQSSPTTASAFLVCQRIKSTPCFKILLKPAVF